MSYPLDKQEYEDFRMLMGRKKKALDLPREVREQYRNEYMELDYALRLLYRGYVAYRISDGANRLPHIKKVSKQVFGAYEVHQEIQSAFRLGDLVGMDLGCEKLKQVYEKALEGVMPLAKERDLQLQKYNISGNRYRELKYFCRQYREKQSQLRSITEIASPSFDGVGGGGGVSDRTGSTAMKKARLQHDLDLIASCAVEADEYIHEYILSNVVDGTGYEYLGVPSSKTNFYVKRKKFFWLLDKKVGTQGT